MLEQVLYPQRSCSLLQEKTSSRIPLETKKGWETFFSTSYCNPEKMREFFLSSFSGTQQEWLGLVEYLETGIDKKAKMAIIRLLVNCQILVFKKGVKEDKIYYLAYRNPGFSRFSFLKIIGKQEVYFASGPMCLNFVFACIEKWQSAEFSIDEITIFEERLVSNKIGNNVSKDVPPNFSLLLLNEKKEND